MVPRKVDVVAGSRLHFGLLSFGNNSVRQFGGAGVMVSTPAVHLRVSPAERFLVTGPAKDRVAAIVRAWSAWRKVESLACRIDVLELPWLHTGLGVGTQLTLSVSHALDAWTGYPTPPIAEVAVAMGRGRRSAVGTYGFAWGGLIAEGGKSEEMLSPLDRRLALPEAWRFVLVCPDGVRGLDGPRENATFQHLPPVPADVSRELVSELQDHLLPAVVAGRFEAFSESVYRFGYRAGLCYATVQGGPYNGPRPTELVRAIRDLGVVGTGQSSWGPTVFAICRDASQAESLIRGLADRQFLHDTQVTVAAPCNAGAQVTVTYAHEETIQ
jgi:beta-RFAP synthase